MPFGACGFLLNSRSWDTASGPWPLLTLHLEMPTRLVQRLTADLLGPRPATFHQTSSDLGWVGPEWPSLSLSSHHGFFLVYFGGCQTSRLSGVFWKLLRGLFCLGLSQHYGSSTWLAVWVWVMVVCSLALTTLPPLFPPSFACLSLPSFKATWPST